MKTKTSIKRSLTLALIGALVSLAGARADTIAENTGGNQFLPLDHYVGQSFTTVTLTPESNITFNFFSDIPATTPYAIGTGFLLSMQYLGDPTALSSSTPGFLGQATASGGFYTFDPSLTLLPATQYFFYENAVIPNNTISGGNIYAGGGGYFAPADPGNHFSGPTTASDNFRVTGIPVSSSVPDSSSTWILLAIGLGAAFGIQSVLQRRPHPGGLLREVVWP